MSVTQQQVIDALRRIRGPDLKSNIVDLGSISEVLIKDGRVSFSITVPPERAAELEPLRQAAHKVVSDLAGVDSVTVVLTADRQGGQPAPRPRSESPRVAAARAAAGQPSTGQPSTGQPSGGHHHGHSHDHGHGRPPAAPTAAAASKAATIPGIKHLIAVASGKGGVGKSTVAVNLALGFASLGLKTGILDADIYGPSQPRLLGLTGKPKANGNRLEPIEAYGLEAMSMGFLVDEATPIIWRGPMVVSALNQMLREVEWGRGGQPLDVLVIDMPPGTGDIQLSMAQQVPLSGAVIVSTPQDLALIDARKGLAMFRKVDVPVLGIVENMSYFECPKCGERTEIFGHGGARQEAEKLELPFLGAIPLHIDIRARSDAGQPIVASAPDSTHAQVFRDIAALAWELLGAEGGKPTAPKLELNPANDELIVTFDTGTQYRLPAEMLRVMSPSAEVQGHSPDQRVTVGGKRNVKIRDLRPVGNYAVRIAFDDGHDTGLFSWPYLQELGLNKDRHWRTYLAELESKGLSRG